MQSRYANYTTLRSIFEATVTSNSLQNPWSNFQTSKNGGLKPIWTKPRARGLHPRPPEAPPYAREAEKEDNSKFIWVRHVSDSDSEEIFTRVRSLPENFEELEEAFNAREAEKEDN